MKKWFIVALSITMASMLGAQGLSFESLGDIDSIMEDNAFNEITNRYSATQLSFFPEQATRLGFDSANNKLDVRTPERDSQALRALRIIQEGLNQINRKKLSEQKKTEYDTLQARLQWEIKQIAQNRTSWDPILYAQAFDALQDLRIKILTYRDLQDRDLAERVHYLPGVAEQAQKNLVSPASFLAQIAMEKAYYAYLSFDEISQYILSRAQDDVSRNQVRTDSRNAKQAIKSMFDLFKKLAQENTDQDFRLGDKDYTARLQNYYFINQKPKLMTKFLAKNFQTAQQNLTKALSAFDLPPAATTQDIVIENIQVPDGEAAEAVTVSAIDQPEQLPAATPQQPEPPVSLGAKFYAISKLITRDVPNQNFIAALAAETKNLSQAFAQDFVLPLSNGTFTVKEMPTYYSYFYPYLFVPPFGTQTNPSFDMFLRLPSGNELAKQEILNRDFNTPTLKLLVAGQLIPGLAYRSAYNWQVLSSFRKLYPVPTLRNGWEVYSQHLANERGYIITDEEQLFLAWADYLRAVQAVADYSLHNRQMTYSEALNWLTEENGINKTTAETMLKQIATQPGEAVSYIYGYDALKNLRAKYQKKLGKKFLLSDFHAKLMNIGDVPPNRLEAEMENAYAREKSRVTQALTSPFYMN